MNFGHRPLRQQHFLGFRAKGLEFRALGFGFIAHGFESWTCCLGFRLGFIVRFMFTVEGFGSNCVVCRDSCLGCKVNCLRFEI